MIDIPAVNQPILEVRHLNVWYGHCQVLYDMNLTISASLITSVIGARKCGKSTLLGSLNRTIQRSDVVRLSGSVTLLQRDLYDPKLDPGWVGRHVGMVFARSAPFPVSIRDNILFGYCLHREQKGRIAVSEADQVVEMALRQVGLWTRLKDQLRRSAARGLTDEERLRLCIARVLPLKPTLLLLDDPCQMLDPQGCAAIEELIWELRLQCAIVLATSNLAQARRLSDVTVFISRGRIVEAAPTDRLFVAPAKHKTADYIEGRSV